MRKSVRNCESTEHHQSHNITPRRSCLPPSVFCCSLLHDWLVSIFKLFSDPQAMREYIAAYGPLAPVISALLMILQSVAAPLPAFLITFANGLLFGVWWGATLSWSSAMLGAALCFLSLDTLAAPPSSTNQRICPRRF